LDVVVVGTQRLVRFAFLQLLRHSPRQVRRIEAPTREAAERSLEGGWPAILLVAGDGLDVEGLAEWLAGLLRRWPSLPVLSWTPLLAPAQVAALYALGVRGLLTGAVSLETLDAAVSRLACGQTYFASEVRPYLPVDAEGAPRWRIAERRRSDAPR
jgi:DNA-binding NarL/FixJ family response regulator